MLQGSHLPTTCTCGDTAPQQVGQHYAPLSAALRRAGELSKEVQTRLTWNGTRKRKAALTDDGRRPHEVRRVVWQTSLLPAALQPSVHLP